LTEVSAAIERLEDKQLMNSKPTMQAAKDQAKQDMMKKFRPFIKAVVRKALPSDATELFVTSIKLALLDVKMEQARYVMTAAAC
jgi:hypothetical protein